MKGMTKRFIHLLKDGKVVRAFAQDAIAFIEDTRVQGIGVGIEVRLITGDKFVFVPASCELAVVDKITTFNDAHVLIIECEC